MRHLKWTVRSCGCAMKDSRTVRHGRPRFLLHARCDKLFPGYQALTIREQTPIAFFGLGGSLLCRFRRVTEDPAEVASGSACSIAAHHLLMRCLRFRAGVICTDLLLLIAAGAFFVLSSLSSLPNWRLHAWPVFAGRAFPWCSFLFLFLLARVSSRPMSCGLSWLLYFLQQSDSFFVSCILPYE